MTWGWTSRNPWTIRPRPRHAIDRRSGAVVSRPEPPKQTAARVRRPARAHPQPPVSPELVLISVAERFGVSPEALVSRDRSQPIARIRQIAMAECRALDFSYPAIAAAFGRHHATVIHAVHAIAERSAPR